VLGGDSSRNIQHEWPSTSCVINMPCTINSPVQLLSSTVGVFFRSQEDECSSNEDKNLFDYAKVILHLFDPFSCGHETEVFAHLPNRVGRDDLNLDGWLCIFSH